MRTSPPGSTVSGMAPGDNRAVSPHGTREEPESCSVRNTGSRRSTPHSPNSSTTEPRRTQVTLI
jgi:hypothetical protein